jgi:hypothetical protein
MERIQRKERVQKTKTKMEEGCFCCMERIQRKERVQQCLNGERRR